MLRRGAVKPLARAGRDRPLIRSASWRLAVTSCAWLSLATDALARRRGYDTHRVDTGTVGIGEQ